MPVKECQSGGRPGFKWGDAGKCYTYTPGDERSRQRAHQQAINQGLAATGGDLEEKSNMFLLKQLGIRVHLMGHGYAALPVTTRDAPLNTVSEPVDDGDDSDDLKKKRKDSVKFSANKAVHGDMAKDKRKKDKRKQRANDRALKECMLVIIENS